MSDETVVPAGAAVADPLPPPPPPRVSEWTMSVAVGIMQLAGLASIGAGAIHAGAAGLHAETPTLARLFVAVAVAQIGVGLLALVKGGRLAAAGTVLVNLGAVAAWGATRLWGISWIDGLEVAEDPEFTDTACAVLGAIAAVAAIVAFVRGRTNVSTVRLGLPAFAVGAGDPRRHARRRQPFAQSRRAGGGRLGCRSTGRRRRPRPQPRRRGRCLRRRGAGRGRAG